VTGYRRAVVLIVSRSSQAGKNVAYFFHASVFQFRHVPRPPFNTNKVIIVAGSSVLRTRACSNSVYVAPPCEWEKALWPMLGAFCKFCRNDFFLFKCARHRTRRHLCATFDVLRPSRSRDIVWRINSHTHRHPEIQPPPPSLFRHPGTD